MVIMSTIDHGKWVLYTPETVPEWFPKGAIHAKRESDQVDWYTYIKGGAHFGKENVKGAAAWWGSRDCYIVGPATKDVTAIFPADCYVFEITNYTGIDPQKDYGGKIYHPENGTFEEYVPPPPPQARDVGPPPAFVELQSKYDALLARIDKLEKSGGG
jgi:hypothetical protein